ncbi:hypothetical protein AND_006391 [Anopheles darlingi]|uniref:Farnesoic acid O-methyl transferase domain-containing protein n=1 Tax=Anopheles darlingi TaxID=43151 RepID=W5JGC9_ANODA|nr:hypothetical protein AND_006391 [Anopheles darlingi]
MGSVTIQFVLGLLLHQCFFQLSVFGNTGLETDYGYRFVAGEDGECNFKVRTASEADIEFAADDAQTKPVFGVLLGGERNTISHIRSSAGVRVEKPTPGILSPMEFRSFWIRWNDQTVTVGKQGSEEPIMTYEVDKVSPTKVIGIKTNHFKRGSWAINK